MNQVFILIPAPLVLDSQDLILEAAQKRYRVTDRVNRETEASGLLLEDKQIVQAIESYIMLNTLMQAVAQYYSEDKTTAGLVMAWLPAQASYYISVCRYNGAFGAGKQVIACTTASSIEEATNKVATIWLTNIGKDGSLQELIAGCTKQS